MSLGKKKQATLTAQDKRRIGDYLQQYGYQSVQIPAKSKARDHSNQKNDAFIYSHVLVVPAYNETTHFIRRLQSQTFLGVEKLLVIVIVNQPDTTKELTRLNQRLITFIDECRELKKDTYQTCSKHNKTDIEILGIQAFIPAKQGVGLARKIGCDLALSMMAAGDIKYSWLFCTDADASLSENYFTPTLTPKHSAVVYEFEHTNKNTNLSFAQREIANATVNYEKSLRYYRDGLGHAGSPYAYTSIGSCMAVHPLYYAQVRGFPRRNAGEDFYLLNKLNKLQPVLTTHIRITLKPRLSSRVAFGTGPAVKKQLASSLLTKDYAPEIFLSLKTWLECAPSLYAILQIHKQQDSKSNLLNSDVDEILKGINLHSNTVTTITSLKAEQLFNHILNQAKSSTQAEKIFHEWFDAFKTLQFIHHQSRFFWPKKTINYPYSF